MTNTTTVVASTITASVTRNPYMDEMTIGEISRSLARLEQSQDKQTAMIAVIQTQTVKTNGYVGRHEERLNGLDREMRDIKQTPRAHGLQRTTDRADAITLSIPTNKKALTVMLSVTGGIIAAAFTALAKLMGWV